MTIYNIDIYEISSKGDICFYDWISKKRFFGLLCLHHPCHVKLDGFRTRNRCLGCWTLSSSHYVRYPTHTTNICCQKENRLVVIPFAANDVFRIMEITFTSGHFLIFFQFWHLLSIWPYCSYGVNSVRSFLRIWSHLMKKSLMENFIFCVEYLIEKRPLNFVKCSSILCSGSFENTTWNDSFKWSMIGLI